MGSVYDYAVKALITALVLVAASTYDVIVSFMVFAVGALLGAGLLVLVDMRQRARRGRGHPRRTP